MKQRTLKALASLIVLVAAAVGTWMKTQQRTGPTPANPVPTAQVPSAPPQSPQNPPAQRPPGAPRSTVGFTSRASLESHFQKHGIEFGRISIDEYLTRAKALRDAPLSANVLERKRADGVITRFDKSTGDFLAFHADKTIRTFFRPNDGEAYFRRQAQRDDE